MKSLAEQVYEIPYWYHKIDLPGGITTPGWAPINLEAYQLPEDMTGANVLDVGCWDGYFSFLAAQRGAAAVLGIETFEDQLGPDDVNRAEKFRTFDLCRDALRLTNVSRKEVSVYDCPNWRFDNIFCFGVLYHLRHPLLALERLRECCIGTIHIETAILDGCQSAYGDYGYHSGMCNAEFYPGDQYGINVSNWWVGTLRFWCSLVQAAGFTGIECWKLVEHPRTLAEARGFIRAHV